MIGWRNLYAGFSVVLLFTAHAFSPVGNDYSQKSVTDLIDELMQIDSQSPGVNSATIYEGFIAGDLPSSFQVGMLGVAQPKVPPQMKELVRRGPTALPEL